MSFRAVNSEVVQAEGPIVNISRVEVQAIRAGALSNSRKRKRLCAHPGPEDRLHEMVIALSSDTFVRPHKHLNKSESMHVIEGRARAIVFENDGKVRQVIPLGDYASGRTFFYRMESPAFHTLLIDSDVLVLHETTNGPFNRAETVYAPWAPDESDLAGRAAYMEKLRREVDGLDTAAEGP